MDTVVFVKASQVAALAGLHKYRDVNLEILELWHASDPLGCEEGMATLLAESERTREASEEEHARILRTAKEVAEVTQGRDSAALQSALETRVAPDIREHVASEVYKKRGTEGEKPSLDRIQEETGRRVGCRNDRLYRKDLESIDALRVRIVGKVDGIDMDTGDLVEVKHRQRCFFEPLPTYDLVQAQVYMWLVGAQRCQFVQVLDGERRTQVLEKDDAYLHDTVWPGVGVAMARLRRLVDADPSEMTRVLEGVRVTPEPRRLQDWTRGVLKARRARCERRCAASGDRR